MTDLQRTIVVVLVGLIATTSAQATITFEGFGPSNIPGTEGTPIPSVRRQGVTVSFTTEDASGVQYIPVLAEVGTPRFAFQSNLGDDMPASDSGTAYRAGGEFSLTDEIRNTRDYIIDFSESVASVSLDLYDFRSDGPHALGNPGSDTVNFQAFDSVGNLIATDSYTVSNPRPIEGNVVNLEVHAFGISQVRVAFNTIEGGTAIDNIRFTVPEPSSLALASLTAVGLLGMRRRRSRID